MPAKAAAIRTREDRASPTTIARVEALDWSAMASGLDAQGCAVTGPLLTAEECAALAARYPEDKPFRSRVIMARHGFGRGEYKYFAYPLPGLIQELRTALYPRLAEIANRWNEAMGIAIRFPQAHEDFLKRCHKAGQTQADAAAAAIRSRRLQLPASGPLRRACLPAAGHGAAVASRAPIFPAASSC